MPAPNPPADREITGDDTIKVTVAGVECTIPAAMDDWPIEAMEAFSRSAANEGWHHSTAFLAAMVGAQKWALIRKKLSTKRDVEQAVNGLLEAAGLISGE